MVSSILSDTKGSNDPFAAELSLLSHSDGSASWRSKLGASVLTSLNGPIEVRIRDELLGEATLELKMLPASGLAGVSERYMERLVRNSIKSCLLLGLHPRSLVQITSQIISREQESDSNLETIAATINSITLACVDAGISMRCMLAAAVVRLPGGSRHVGCYSYPMKELMMVESFGPCSRVELAHAMTLALQQCDAVYSVMKNVVEEKVARDNVWKGT